MKKYLIVVWALIMILPSALGQDKLRVAILDPSASGTSIDEGTKLAVQELISSTFVNTGKYIMIERSMIDKIMKEQAFQNSDMADNSQATELGKLVGANKVVLSAVSLVGGRNMLSIKIIDVQTATIDQQKTKIVNTNDLLDVVEPLTLELLGERAVYKKQETKFDTQTQEEVKEVKEEKPQKSNTSMENQVSIYTGCGIEIMINDLPGEYSWDAAMRACPQGWRLPTSKELECMCKSKKFIDRFYGEQYWSSDKKSDKKAISRTTNDCEVENEDIEDEHRCRCVRNRQ
ncbi:MAG: hypothetical protein LBG80_15960 [Bacteroidales bacterium]|jgi:hypothetical protein|nr:hypothetical protein [Bacteroidales bacterium]